MSSILNYSFIKNDYACRDNHFQVSRHLIEDANILYFND